MVQIHFDEFAADGAISMVGVHFATKLNREVLHLFRTHCIVYKKALTYKDGVETITHVASLEKLFNRLNGWIGKSFLRNKALQGLLIVME